MTNAIQQTIASSCMPLGVSMRKGADRLRQHAVRLYSANNEPLFFWSGKAKTSFDAVALARATYSNAIEAIFRAGSGNLDSGRRWIFGLNAA